MFNLKKNHFYLRLSSLLSLGKVHGLSLPAISLVIALLMSVVLPNQLLSIPASIVSDYELVWEDPFDGTELDSGYWTITEGIRDSATNVPDAIEVSNGLLKIRTYTDSGTHYTGFINTIDGFMFPFGYFEARVRMDLVTSGMWSAFWLMPDSIPPADAEAGAEIDIFEYRAATDYEDVTDLVSCGLVWNGYNKAYKISRRTDPEPTPLGSGVSLQDGQFHTYAVLRTSTTYEFYFDDQLIWSHSADGFSYAYSNILLTCHVKPAEYWSGPIPTAGYGAKGAANNPVTSIDWVRVYNLKPSESGQTAFVSHTVPGFIEAEDFDEGGKGVGYYDKVGTGSNSTEYGTDTTYRAGTFVDIDTSTSASNGRYVANTAKNEWLEYTLQNAQNGAYSVEAIVANGDTSNHATMNTFIDGQFLGRIYIDETGGIDNWEQQSFPGIAYLDSQYPSVMTTEVGRNINFSLDGLQLNYLGNVWDFREAESGSLSSNLSTLGTFYASNSQYISGFSNSIDSAVYSGVDGFDGGDVQLTIRYARNGNANKSPGIKLKVNGSFLTDGNGADLYLPFSAGDDWNVYRNFTITVPGMLSGLNNIVELESNGVSNQPVRIDYLFFSKHQQSTTLMAEAEGNEFGQAYIGTSSNASGGSYVNGMNKWGSGVHWQNIQSSTAGTRTLTIHYAKNNTADIFKVLEVNGVDLGLISFDEDTGSWNNFTGVLQMSVDLVAGANDLKLWRSGVGGDGGALRIDYITLSN